MVHTNDEMMVGNDGDGMADDDDDDGDVIETDANTMKMAIPMMEDDELHS